MKTRNNKWMILGVVTLSLTGCGPNLTGSFTGTHDRQMSGYSQRYQAQLTLNQNGDKLTGQVISTPSSSSSSSSTSTGSYYPQSYSILNGQIEGTVSGNVVSNVRMSLYENGCPVLYTGSFTIADGSKLQGMLVSSTSSSSSGSTSTCPGTYGTSSSTFSVSK